EPSDALVDGQEVEISGENFPGGGFTSLEYCEVGGDRCDRVFSTSVDIEADGTFDITVALYADLVVFGGTVNCQEPPGCEVRAGDYFEGYSVSVPVTFRPTGPR